MGHRARPHIAEDVAASNVETPEQADVVVYGATAGAAACLAIDGHTIVQSIDYDALKSRLLADQQRLIWPYYRSSSAKSLKNAVRREASAINQNKVCLASLFLAFSKDSRFDGTFILAVCLIIHQYETSLLLQ